MREIKFRGKRVDHGEWVYGYAIFGKDGQLAWIITEGREATYGLHPEQNIFRVIPETVGQYTGLKDKEGTEIYEGDIVRGSGLGVVEYDTGHLNCGFVMNRGRFAGQEHHVEMPLGIPSSLVVIGNIHDNPELIK